MQKKVKGKSLLSYSQNPHNLASFSVKIDSPQEILLRPRSRPRRLLLLLRFLVLDFHGVDSRQ